MRAGGAERLRRVPLFLRISFLIPTIPARAGAAAGKPK